MKGTDALIAAQLVEMGEAGAPAGGTPTTPAPGNTAAWSKGDTTVSYGPGISSSLRAMNASVRAAPNTNAPSQMRFPGKQAEQLQSQRTQHIIHQTTSGGIGAGGLGRQGTTAINTPNLVNRTAPGTASNSSVDAVRAAAAGLSKK